MAVCMCFAPTLGAVGKKNVAKRRSNSRTPHWSLVFAWRGVRSIGIDPILLLMDGEKKSGEKTC